MSTIKLGIITAMPAEYRCIPKPLRGFAVCGGVGQNNAATAATKLVVEHDVDVLISMGVAGALQSSLVVGTALNIREVIDSRSGESFPCELIFNFPEQHTLLSSDHPISRIDNKLGLGRKFSAHAVDIESAAIARVAREHNKAFWCLRAVSDDTRHEIPEEVVQFINGDGSLLILMKTVCNRPSLMVELFYLARNYRIALRQLKKMIAHLKVASLIGEP